ncbi:MFS transporter [Geodermatophilus sp. SYSU D01176]
MSGRATDGGTFRSLRVRNYRVYASANLVSLTGTWMQRIGQDWLVLQLSGDDGVALGLVTALQFGPTLLLGMYGGVLADRYPKRRVLLATQTLMGLVALLLGVLVASDASPCGTCSCSAPRWARSPRSTPRSGRRSSRRWSAPTC